MVDRNLIDLYRLVDVLTTLSEDARTIKNVRSLINRALDRNLLAANTKRVNRPTRQRNINTIQLSLSQRLMNNTASATKTGLRKQASIIRNTLRRDRQLLIKLLLSRVRHKMSSIFNSQLLTIGRGLISRLHRRNKAMSQVKRRSILLKESLA